MPDFGEARPTHRLTSWIATALSAALVAGGTASAQTVTPAPPSVTVSQPLQKEITEWDQFTGQFQAVDFVEIRARVAGYLTEIHFQDGQTVKKGDLLFVIDPRPYEATLASMRAQLSQAEAQVDLAQVQLKRSTELRKRDFEPASSYDQRVSDLKVASAAVEAAKAGIRTAELNVEFTRITAPMAGRISRHQVSIGNLISGGEGGAATLLTTIVSLDPIYFNFDMSESDYLAYQRATEKGLMRSTRDNTVAVSLRLTDEKGWPHEGRMNFVENRVDRSSGTIRVRAVFPNPNLLFTAGQFGRIRIPGSEPYKAILVPDAAVVTDQSRKIVLTVNDENVVVPKIIRPGPSYEGLRIVRSGLLPTDKVVINGLLRARPGSKVAPKPGTIEVEPETD
jgi:RND family efflux transporter MFP subunit